MLFIMKFSPQIAHDLLMGALCTLGNIARSYDGRSCFVEANVKEVGLHVPVYLSCRYFRIDHPMLVLFTFKYQYTRGASIFPRQDSHDERPVGNYIFTRRMFSESV